MTDRLSPEMRARTNRNIPPPLPGEVRNPKGHNQYTYRREAEKRAAKLAAGELSAHEADSLPEWVRDCVEPGMTRAEVLVAMAFAGGLRGDQFYFREALKRVWAVPDQRKEEAAAQNTPAPWFEQLGDPAQLDPEERRKLIDLAHAELSKRRLDS